MNSLQSPRATIKSIECPPTPEAPQKISSFLDDPSPIRAKLCTKFDLGDMESPDVQKMVSTDDTCTSNSKSTEMTKSDFGTISSFEDSINTTPPQSVELQDRCFSSFKKSSLRKTKIPSFKRQGFTTVRPFSIDNLFDDALINTSITKPMGKI